MQGLVKLDRRTFQVDGVRITPDNMAEAAEWAKGEVKLGEMGYYIEFDTITDRLPTKAKAFVGDWITGGKVFKVYGDASLRSIFQEQNDTKLLTVLDLVAKAMVEQHKATIHGVPESTADFCKEISRKIYGIL